MTNKRVIIDELLPRLYNTMFLAGYAALIAIPLSVGLGILAAINEGKTVDRAANVLTLITISVPEVTMLIRLWLRAGSTAATVRLSML